MKKEFNKLLFPFWTKQITKKNRKNKSFCWLLVTGLWSLVSGFWWLGLSCGLNCITRSRQAARISFAFG